jgi:hypothetical protein
MLCCGLGRLGLWGFGMRGASWRRCGARGTPPTALPKRSRSRSSYASLDARTVDEGITGLEDQTSSHRPDSKKGRRLAEQRRRHGARTCGGGARIGCPRANVSKTIIAAPQCMQTKVG